MSRTFGHFKDKDTEAQPGSSNWLKVMWLRKAASRIPAHMPGPSVPPTNHSCGPHPLFFELGWVLTQEVGSGTPRCSPVSGVTCSSTHSGACAQS